MDNYNLDAFHPCGARCTRGNICHKVVRSPKRFCGTHQRQYNLYSANDQHPELWEAHQRKLARKAELRTLAWVNRHPVLSQFRNMPVEQRMTRYILHTNFFGDINVALQETTGYIFPHETIHVNVLNNIPEPMRGFLRRIADRVNNAINLLWTTNADMHGETIAIVHEIFTTAPPRPPPPGELAQFAHDNQNVHKTVTVNMVKEVVDRILKIPVPDKYKYTHGNWTPGEVMCYVPMSSETMCWFAKKYTTHEDIYEFGPGIYAKVMDAVWQYIRNSPDKEDLCKILGVELLDSVNMCAQGNLTRICNVLAGYLEGINTETQGEQLQRRMAKLMELENPEDRIREGKKILEELAVPVAEQDAWIEALT